MDAGTYTCTATNRLGYIEAVGTLLVRSKYSLFVRVCVCVCAIHVVCLCARVCGIHVDLKQCNIDPVSLTSVSSDRLSWQTLCHKAVTEFEDSRVAALVHK